MATPPDAHDDEHNPLTTKDGWRQFVDDAPASPPMLSLPTFIPYESLYYENRESPAYRGQCGRRLEPVTERQKAYVDFLTAFHGAAEEAKTIYEAVDWFFER